MKLSKNGVEMLKDWEGTREKPYDDHTGREISSWTEGITIGVGHLILQSEWELYKYGLNENEIEALLSKDLKRFERAVNKKIKVPLKQYQFDALVILAFNIGVGEGYGVDSFMNSSVVKLINGESGSNYNTLEKAWLVWKKSRGKIIPSLEKRRESEHKLYTQGIYTKRSKK